VNTLWLFFIGLPLTHLRLLDYVQLIVFRFWRLWLLLALIFVLHRAWLLAVSTFCNLFGLFSAQLGVKLGWLVGSWISSFLFTPATAPLGIELGLRNVSASFVPWTGLSLDSLFLQAAMKFLRQHHLLITYFGVPGFVANSVVLLLAWSADR
jgi:hypothetical protein